MSESFVPVGYLLKRAQASLRLAMDEALRSHDLSMAQYALLFNLEREAGLTNAELARRAFVTPQTTIRIVADLEDAGFVKRTADPSNRRRLKTSITPAGQKRVRAAETTVLEVEKRMLGGFADGEVAKLRDFLEQAAINLDPSPERPPTATRTTSSAATRP